MGAMVKPVVPRELSGFSSELLVFDEWLTDENDILEHIGTPHEGNTPHSGRYPFGSGDHPYQRAVDFYGAYNRYKAEGLSEKEIAEKLACFNKYGKVSVLILRTKYANAKAEKRAGDRELVLKYTEEGLSNVQIGEKMGINESTVRSLKDESKAIRNNLNKETAETLKAYVNKYRYVDVSSGTNIALGVTPNRLDNAIALLEDEGYKRQLIQIDQMGTDHKTTFSVLTAPDVTYSELSENRYDIRYPGQDSRVLDEGGNVLKLGINKPECISSDRIEIVYAEQGGTKRDGLMEIRRGVDDISIGSSQYAQIRMGVDGTHYLKGMAVYGDKFPPGKDIIFYTNKHEGTPLEKVLKPMKGYEVTDENGKVIGYDKSKIDWDNPFGATVTQLKYDGPNGEERHSAANIVRKEGEWQVWDKNLASQFLSKQNQMMAKRQLTMASDDKKAEFEEIMRLTNPAVKQKLLETFADKCDSLAVDLKAAPFAGQQTHVILPFPKLKDNEIYAPNYKDGTRVALVRYPHGGTFEIPELTVRNTGSPAAKVIRNAPDAVGINSHVAGILSGADFDGDTVVVIPLSDKVKVRSTPALEGLKNFDPKEQYPAYDGMKVISSQGKQLEMGKVTNLITDMTLKGATYPEIAMAVRHSMVIIDAEKHKLNYKQSEIDNHIAELKKKYQDNGDGKTGAGTIISRASSEADVLARKQWRLTSTSVDAEGNKIYQNTNETYLKGILKGRTKKDGGEVIVNVDVKTGQMYYLDTDKSTGKKVRQYVTRDDFKNDLKEVPRLQKSTKMAEVDDAYKLTSGGSKENPGYPMEAIYARYANDMKDLARKARLAYLNTPNLERNADAAAKYKAEVESLNNKLELAKANAPLERQAQLLANRVVACKKADNPNMSSDQLKRLKGQAIQGARDSLGAHKTLIDPTDREWEAIQAGAISHSKLRDILNNSDLDKLRERATPRTRTTISPTMESLAHSMSNSGYTTAQIADRLGISVSSVYGILK